MANYKGHGRFLVMGMAQQRQQETPYGGLDRVWMIARRPEEADAFARICARPWVAGPVGTQQEAQEYLRAGAAAVFVEGGNLELIGQLSRKHGKKRVLAHFIASMPESIAQQCKACEEAGAGEIVLSSGEKALLPSITNAVAAVSLPVHGQGASPVQIAKAGAQGVLLEDVSREIAQAALLELGEAGIMTYGSISPNLDCIKFDDKGLVPAIAQDARSGAVLMLAYMNEESLHQTLNTGFATYYSRSRQQLWKKGDTSGHLQRVVSLRYDCDADTVLMEVLQKGAACHTGETSCFHNTLYQDPYAPAQASVLGEVFGVVLERMAHPKEGSYTNYLLDKGVDKILKKVGEESAETIIAAKNAVYDEIALETGDLLYHVMVLLAERGLHIHDLYDDMQARR